ncbi:MAG: cysteine--tRNA ligase, partial [Saprospiraceae bacterium]|nr:cysteine--tRNA ligase [Saprospiraceae bacterium]
HLECSAMSTKYLGQTFDIHGGGNDLKFPHHENEIAQSYGACGHAPAKYWLHTNMLLLNSKKMSKSDGNTITPVQLFTGNSPFVTKGYSPMTLRFFMLMAHYRSTLDITDEALQAAEKGFRKLMEIRKSLHRLATTGTVETETDRAVLGLLDQAYQGMDDDFNTAIALASLNELGGYINKITNGQLAADALSTTVLEKLKFTFDDFVFNILGLQEENPAEDHTVQGLMELVLDVRAQARSQKDWPTSDKIRDVLAAVGIQVKDGKEGATWTKN